jgi:hypothetical protein
MPGFISVMTAVLSGRSAVNHLPGKRIPAYLYRFHYSAQAYTVTCGTESAFSYSNDGGVTWNQISLIDTKISDIPDIATPLTNIAFMLTFNGDNQKHSLWRTTESGTNWDRIFYSSLTGIDNLNMVKTIPQYSSDSPTILIARKKDDNPIILKSNDIGQLFTPRMVLVPLMHGQLLIAIHGLSVVMMVVKDLFTELLMEVISTQPQQK